MIFWIVTYTNPSAFNPFFDISVSPLSNMTNTNAVSFDADYRGNACTNRCDSEIKKLWSASFDCSELNGHCAAQMAQTSYVQPNQQSN